MKELMKIYSLIVKKKYSDALKEIEKFEGMGLVYPKLFVLKAHCIALSDELEKYTYKDILLSYKKALSIDDDFVEALIRLGYHYYGSHDNSKKAIPLFDKSLNILKDQVVDSIVGYANCIEELESPQKAIRYLRKVKSEFLNVKKIDDLIQEFSEK